jgi:hypothetical protein
MFSGHAADMIVMAIIVRNDMQVPMILPVRLMAVTATAMYMVISTLYSRAVLIGTTSVKRNPPVI